MQNLKLSQTCQIPNLVDIYKKYFKNETSGTFVEVGAFDGESYSNSSGLADIGWQGIYVEPVREFAERCALRHTNNRVTVVNAAIDPSPVSKTIDLYVGDALSTLLTEHVDLYQTIPWAKDVEFKKSTCQTVRLDQLLHEQNIKPHFDLLIIDVEGFEEQVLESFDLSAWLPKMMIIELVDKHPDFKASESTNQACQRIRQKIQEQGYIVVYEDIINTIFLHDKNSLQEIYKGELNLGALPSLLNRIDPVILDIGTNNGGHTKAFFDLFPYGSIHSFEPDPRCIAKFKANLSNYPRAKLYEIAIGAFNGSADFYASGGQNLDVGYTMPEGWDMSGSLRKPKEHLIVNPGITFDNQYPVTVVTLDTWFQSSGLDRIDFIWADVQGAEGDLIEGGKETFSKHVKYFYTEYSDTELYENQLNLEKILALLPSFSIVAQFENDVLLKNNSIV